ncbi:MAG: type II secretion system protein GspK, partial [Gammaproteobacteria bacterium]
GVDADVVDTFIAERLESAKNGLPVPPFPSSSGQNASTGRNNAFTIISEALLNDESSAVITAVITQADETEKNPFQVLKWEHVTANDASLFTGAMSELLVKQYAEPEFNN